MLSNEILFMIFDYLENDDLLNLKLSCFRFKDLISNTKLNLKLCYKLYSYEIELFCKYVPKYRNIECLNITDKELKYLGEKGVDIIDLRGCSVTDEGIKSLTSIKGVHTIYLGGAFGIACGDNITDEALKYLGKDDVHTIHISWCRQKITDKGLRYLTKSIKNITLISIYNVTEELVKEFRNKGIKVDVSAIA